MFAISSSYTMPILKNLCSSFTPSFTTSIPPTHPHSKLNNLSPLQYHPSKTSLKRTTKTFTCNNPKLIIQCSTYPNLDTPSLICPGLVFSLGNLSSWDSHAIGSPVVKRFLSDEEERWYMWYHGSGASQEEVGVMRLSRDIVGLAVSSNGVHWERGKGGKQSANDVGIVLNVSEDWWGLDTHSVRPAEVVVMSSSKIQGSSVVYWLYYTGYSNSEEALGLSELVNDSEKNFMFDDQVKVFGSNGRGVCKSLPGLAMSQDGRHWARIEGEHHSGALFDVGSEGEWDSTIICSPQVVFHQPGDLRMYYHSYDVRNSCFMIGVARSRDGMKWIKLGKVLGAGNVGAFDELGVLNACVVKSKNGGSYVMAYEAVSASGGRSVGLAVSADGLRDWRRMGERPILEAADGDSWDNGGVGSPCLVHMEGESSEWRLYYKGVGKDGKSGIGMAVSGKGGQMAGFERWNGFQL